MRPRQQRVVPPDGSSGIVVRVLEDGDLARSPTGEARLRNWLFPTIGSPGAESVVEILLRRPNETALEAWRYTDRTLRYRL